MGIKSNTTEIKKNAKCSFIFWLWTRNKAPFFLWEIVERGTSKVGRKRKSVCTVDCVTAHSAPSSASSFRLSLFPLLFPSSYLCSVNKSDQTSPSLLGRCRTADSSISLHRATRLNTCRMDPCVYRNRAKPAKKNLLSLTELSAIQENTLEHLFKKMMV